MVSIGSNAQTTSLSREGKRANNAIRKSLRIERGEIRVDFRAKEISRQDKRSQVKPLTKAIRLKGRENRGRSIVVNTAVNVGRALILLAIFKIVIIQTK